MSVVQKAPLASLEIENRWDDAHAARLSPAELLLYRSNLLGGDKRITNFGGGNTSAKLNEKDPLTGAEAEVLWVKGSGGDLGTMKLDGFSTLYMEKFRALEKFYRASKDGGKDPDSTLVPLYAHCAFNLNPRAASIDTPLHGLIDRAHVDHMHPDALIAIAASADSKKLTEEIFGGDIGWLPWIRPGYELGVKLRELTQKNPKLKGAVLEAHGLFTWGDSSRDCYENTLDIINRATQWLTEHARGKRPFGAVATPALTIDRRREIAAGLMPVDSRPDLGWRTGAAPMRGSPRGDAPTPHSRWATSTTAKLCWISSAAKNSPVSRRSALPVPITSCAPRSGRWCCPSIRRAKVPPNLPRE